LPSPLEAGSPSSSGGRTPQNSVLCTRPRFRGETEQSSRAMRDDSPKCTAPGAFRRTESRRFIANLSVEQSTSALRKQHPLSFGIKLHAFLACDWRPWPWPSWYVFVTFPQRVFTARRVVHSRNAGVKLCLWNSLIPDGHFKFPHPWPPQIPPGSTYRL
jgi:hypothetical protein